MAVAAAVVVVDVNKVEGIVVVVRDDCLRLRYYCLVGQRLKATEVEQLTDHCRAGRCRRGRTSRGGRIQLIVVIAAFDAVGC